MNRSDFVMGILAHVDAGKTTLAESILYLTGTIRKAGRVDHGDAFLDTHSLEKERGITIFAKQARTLFQGTDEAGESYERGVTILDTPGHVDFSAETERTLQVLDVAVLVVSGSDKVQGHTETLWRLLKRYKVPTFLFINKMDQPDTDREEILADLRAKLDENCVDFNLNREDEAFLESAAMCSDALMEQYLEQGCVSTEGIAQAISQRKMFPCFFGSALKMQGVEELLEGMAGYVATPDYPQQFGARVYKIERDSNNNRLTFLKVTGGSMKVKTFLGKEKIDQIRYYSGTQFKLTDEAPAGSICAVTGPQETYSGQHFGAGLQGMAPSLVPVLTYGVILPEGCDIHTMLKNLYLLQEEDPQLHVVWQEQREEIQVQVMGQVQLEILKSLIAERFGVEVQFDAGRIVYKETILDGVEGIGHYEPLRHYAEVHLWMEPLERGAGLIFDTDCPEEELDKNWQRLILTHLEEKKYIGVLTGSEITDMRITVIGGRAHLKHTEGGDFRQSTYRAVRQGLRKTRSLLLEPYYEYVLELPTENLGRAMTDIQNKAGNFKDPVTGPETSILQGIAPVATLNGYQMEVNSYTRGRGRLTCRFHGYLPCHNAEEVINEMNYDADRDQLNTADSVFCAHGAGFVVPWYQVDRYAHVSTEEWHKRQGGEGIEEEEAEVMEQRSTKEMERVITQEEIEQIFLQTFHRKPLDKNPWNRGEKKQNSGVLHGTGNDAEKTGAGEETGKYAARQEAAREKAKRQLDSYLLVDGYNIIFAWEELNELSKTNVEAARSKMMDILCNYQGYIGDTVIVVFDAYKVKGNPGTAFPYHNIHVVYTKEAETADQYIEKVVHEIGRKYRVTVATSDGLEQLIIWGQGAARLSAQELKKEIDRVSRERFSDWQEGNETGRYFPLLSHPNLAPEHPESQ